MFAGGPCKGEKKVIVPILVLTLPHLHHRWQKQVF
jgi:hypothetical protein